MIRVVGDAPLWVEIDHGAIVVSSPVGWLRLFPLESAQKRAELQQAEWDVEAGRANPQLQEGWIVIVGYAITPVQSEHLRSLLERAETIVETGVGEI